jgi:hypothetical protein
MKKLILALALALGSTQATVIDWTASNDDGKAADPTASDLYYTGVVSQILFENGDFAPYNVSDVLIGQLTVIDVNNDMFYITKKAPDAYLAPASILLSGKFVQDLSTVGITTNVAYELTNVQVFNTIGSAALTEFASLLAGNNGATYTFSMQKTLSGFNNGSGEIASVPEPTTLGLMGLGLLGFGLAAVRRRKA